MARRDGIQHHAGRALEELERARSATCEEAAFAHLELSELHLAERRRLAEEPRPKLRLVSSNPERETKLPEQKEGSCSR